MTYNISPFRLPGPEKVVAAARGHKNASDQKLVDSFWHLKDQVYRCVINSTVGVSADLVIQASMLKHIRLFTSQDYLTTESEVFRKLPTLQKAFGEGELFPIARTLLPPKQSCLARRFDIDPRRNFFAREDALRYTQRRIERELDLVPILGFTGGLYRQGAFRRWATTLEADLECLRNEMSSLCSPLPVLCPAFSSIRDVWRRNALCSRGEPLPSIRHLPAASVHGRTRYEVGLPAATSGQAAAAPIGDWTCQQRRIRPGRFFVYHDSAEIRGNRLTTAMDAILVHR